MQGRRCMCMQSNGKILSCFIWTRWGKHMMEHGVTGNDLLSTNN
jgi:hypothetical protein